MPSDCFIRILGQAWGTLFQWQDGTPLSKSKFVEAVWQGLSAANLPAQQFASHSFRIGAATTAAMVGLQDSAIQTLGRWRSDCYQLYQSSALGINIFVIVKKFNLTCRSSLSGTHTSLLMLLVVYL